MAPSGEGCGDSMSSYPRLLVTTVCANRPSKTGARRPHFANPLIPQEERVSLNSTVANRRPKKGDTVSLFSKRSESERLQGSIRVMKHDLSSLSLDIQFIYQTV